VTFLQRELLSTFFTIENWTKAPRILDVDDAIWVRRGGKFAQRLAQCCDLVICGNSFLAERFSQWNPQICILATPVDTDVYRPTCATSYQKKRIGWSGTSGELKQVYAIESSLKSVLDDDPLASVVIVSDRPPEFRKLPPERVEFVRWSPEAELKALRNMSVGIMPVQDNEQGRGKCSLKMLCYMACNLPVVVSPVGMNVDVLGDSACGYSATTNSDWVEALKATLKDPDKAERMGQTGRNIVEQQFSLRVLSPKLAQILRHFAG
jgi:glycosyltransferase involved in cell wall biosynthesis